MLFRGFALAALLLLVFSGVAAGAVSFNNTNTPISQGSGNPLSGAQTVNAGSNLVAVAYVSWNDANEGIDVSCSYGGASMTEISSRIRLGSTNIYLKALRLINPATGSNTLECTFTNANAIFQGAVLQSYTGVDQTSPVRTGTTTTFSGSTGSGGTQAISVTTATNDLTVTSIASTEGSPTSDPPNTLRVASLISASYYLAVDDGSGSSPVTHTWDTHTAISSGIAMLGFSLQEPAGGGGGDTTPPSTPASITLSATTSSTNTATWTASTDNVAVTGYQLERCSGAGCSSFAAIASVTSTNFVDTGLTPSTIYNYRVKAFDAAFNSSGYATSGETTTLALQARTLTWTPTAPFTHDGFAIYRCVTSDTTCTPTTTSVYASAAPSATSHVDTSGGLPVSCYQVQATLAGTGGSGLSNIACNAAGAVTLTITAAGTGTGTTTPAIGITIYATQTEVNLTATTGVTSDFGGWSGDADCTDGLVTMSTSHLCTATFNLQQDTFGYLGNRGTRATQSFSNTVSVTPSATISQTNLLIVRAVTDNTSTTSGSTNEHTGVTDTLGNQYIKLGEVTRSAGAANSGVTTSLWASRPFASVTTVNSVTLTTATSRVSNTIALEEYRLRTGVTFATSPISNVGTTGQSTSPSAVLSALSSVVRLFLANVGVEGPSSDTYTQGVNYASGTTANGTTSSATTSNVTSQFGFRRQTATGDNYAPTLGTSRNWSLLYVSLATATAQNAASLVLTNSGTGGGTVTGAGTYYAGTNVTITATPNASSQFVAWQNVAGDNCASTTNQSVVVQLTQNTTCNAVFTLAPPVIVNHTLTLATAGTGNGTVSSVPPAGSIASGTVVNITATPDSNSSFDGWSPAICSPGSFTLTADTTCTATFTLLPLATMTTVNAGTGTGVTTGAGTYFQGQTAVLTATPAVGSVFSGWSGSSGCTGSTSPLNVLMDASKTCTATYTVPTGGGPTGSITVSPYRTCSVQLLASLSTGGPISSVVWRINGVRKRSSTTNLTVQTVAPFLFTQSLVPTGALITADVTDTAGRTGTFGPYTVSCP